MSTRFAPFCLTLLFSILILPNFVHADNWPGWRGPTGDGRSEETNLPIHWNAETGQNIVWEVALPGIGHASPIVWKDSVFSVSSVSETQERVLFCLDRESGVTRWQRTVITAPLESKHSLNSHASGTPVTDGESVFATFLEPDGRIVPAPNVGTIRDITAGKIVVASYDFQGELRWLVRPGEFISAHGYCSCPILFENKVIINGDHDGDSYVVALNKATGDIAWRFARKHKTRSYVTPIIRNVDGQPQMVLSGSKSIVSLDPRDGSLLWEIDGPTEQFVASMVYDGSLFFMTCGFPDYHVMGIRPDGHGNVTDTHVAWHAQNARCYVPSPVVLDGFLMIADDRGTGNCFNAATGERYWQKRMGPGYSASLVHAGGLVYWTANDGVTKVIRPGRDLEVLTENPLGEDVSASLAMSQGNILIRGDKHLFCIGDTQ